MANFSGSDGQFGDEWPLGSSFHTRWPHLFPQVSTTRCPEVSVCWPPYMSTIDTRFIMLGKCCPSMCWQLFPSRSCQEKYTFRQFCRCLFSHLWLIRHTGVGKLCRHICQKMKLCWKMTKSIPRWYFGIRWNGLSSILQCTRTIN